MYHRTSFNLQVHVSRIVRGLFIIITKCIYYTHVQTYAYAAIKHNTH